MSMQLTDEEVTQIERIIEVMTGQWEVMEDAVAVLGAAIMSVTQDDTEYLRGPRSAFARMGNTLTAAADSMKVELQALGMDLK